MCTLFAGLGYAQSLVRVPADRATLQQAVVAVADGGTIEVSAGTYAVPASGLEIGNLRKSITIRSAAGERVVIDGGGDRPLVRAENSVASRGGPFHFQGLVFSNGFSDTNQVSGGVTVNTAEASFEDCEWLDNVSTKDGAGLLVVDSTVTVTDGIFEDNRVNISGHRTTSAGGAVYVLNSVFRVAGSRFERNEAGFAGGAIYAFGHWQSDLSAAVADVSIVRSSFVDNRVQANACCTAPGPSAGGAVHVEDHATARIHDSTFSGNEADQGGAINFYRSVGSIHGSIFEANRSIPSDGSTGVGGAIFAVSSDFADSSTDFGAINRRSAEISISGSLLAGVEGGTDAHNGGCLTVAGDGNRMYGQGGVAQDGDLETNRAVARLDGVVFQNCQVEKLGTAAGLGGALHAVLADLEILNSLVLSSEAQGTNASGGGIAMLTESTAEIVSTAFAGNQAGGFGGAIWAAGSHLDVAESSFHGNDAQPGFDEPIPNSTGSAILTKPLAGSSPAVNATGTIRDSLFAENEGVPIREEDHDNGPINEMVYNGNRFTDSTHGDEIYLNALSTFAGNSASELNNLVINRNNGTSSRKSNRSNTRLSSSPREGLLIAAPPSLPPTFTVGGESSRSHLAWAFTGSGTATLGGSTLGEHWGAVETTTPGTTDLVLAGSTLASAEIESSYCASSSLGLCLNRNRFFVDASWQKSNGERGIGRSETLTDDTGYFWFFNPENIESVVKVLDALGINGKYWVFYGALSDVKYSLFITDLSNGAIRVYDNPQGTMASVADTFAFDAASQGPGQAAQAPLPQSRALPPSANCAADATHLCLNGDRFRVGVEWTKATGEQGSGQAVALTGDTGYFWFFRESNVELILKVLDGRPLNQHFWVFYGALSDVHYEVTVVDTETSEEWTFTNPQGSLASGSDTRAFPDGP